jgi:hypothetical protein
MFKAIFLITCFLFTGATVTAQEVCGVYLIEDYTNVEVHTLTKLTSSTGRQIHYAIANPASAAVRLMVTGRCYCVNGEVQLDPAFQGDRDYRRISVESIAHACNSTLRADASPL